MATNDIILTQLDASSDWNERTIAAFSQGALITGDSSGYPTKLTAGAATQILSVNASGDLEWIDQAAGHTQNTDTGTTQTSFTINSDSTTGKVIIGTTTTNDYEITIQNGALTANRTLTLPDKTGTVALTSDIPADAMVFKGTIDCSTNPNYPSGSTGDTYKVSAAGKIGGASGSEVEIGDTVYCVNDNSGGDEATVGSDWNIIQVNIDGAVTGASSATDNAIARYDGTTGVLIQNSSVTIDDSGSINIPSGQSYKIGGTALSYSDVGAEPALTKGNLTETTSSVLTITGGTSAVIGSGVTIAVAQAGASDSGYLSSTDWNTFNNKMKTWTTAPASQTASGTAGDIAYDNDYLYICVATNSWKRTAIAKW